MFHLVTSWQHMATFQTTTRTYQDRTCRVCPTYSLGSQGCDAWLPATTAMKVEHTGKKQRGKQRSSKMFQDVSTVTKRCLNFRSSFSDFRRSLLHVSYDLTKSGKHGKRRSMSPFSKPHGCGSPGTTDIPWIYPQNVIFCSCTQNCKKTLKHGLENRPFSLIDLPFKTFIYHYIIIWWDVPAHH